jgi:hypothetical protein
MLRKAGETAQFKTRKITLNDLGNNEAVGVEKSTTTTTVVVTRASSKQDYTVPVEGGALAETARKQLTQ